MVPCPHCGEPLPENATFCRYCGSDAETGWDEDVDYHSVELPEREWDEEAESSRTSTFTQVTAWVCLFGAVLFVFRGRWTVVLLIGIGVAVFLALRSLSARRPPADSL